MGLSSSRSKTTTNTNQNSSETTSGSQVPIAPPWLTQAAQDYVGRIGAFGEMDPNAFVAGASPLQQAAWQNALPALSGWQPQMATAAQQALAAGQAGANTAGPAASMQAATGQASTFNAPQIAGTMRPRATGYTAPAVGQNRLVSGQGYQAPDLANAQGYAAARTGRPIGAAQTNVAPTQNAQASDAQAASLLQNLNQYQNPFQRQVIDASLAQFDRDAAQQSAALAARGARSGAFGGSRFGIAEGQFASDAALGRSSLGAGLRAQGFEQAAALSGQDAARRQETGLFNAGNRTGVSLANAGAANQRALAQAGLSQDRNLFNAGQANAMALDQAGRQDAASQFTAGARNQFGLAQAGLQENAGQFNAQQEMQAQLANQQAGLQRNLAQAGLQADAGQFGAAAQNQMGLAGYQGQLQTNLAQGGFDMAAAQANAGARNTFGLANIDARNQANAQNMAAQNQFALFNAGQQDNAANRQLQSAQLLGGMANDFAGNTRQDLATMAALGDQQRGIEQQQVMAPLAQLQMMGQLSGMTPYDILVGRQIQGNTTGTTTGTGTSVTRSSPSLFDQLLQAANTAARFL